MRRVAAILGGAATTLIFVESATQFLAHVFSFQTALGRPLFELGGSPIYAPWFLLDWSACCAASYPKPFAVAQFIALLGLVSGVCVASIALSTRPTIRAFGRDAWARQGDVEDAGLFATSGVILGKFNHEIL